MVSIVNVFIFLGGPLIILNKDELNGERFVLLGTIHGAFTECTTDLPSIFVEVDDLKILDFLYKKVFGSGL